MIGPVGGTFTLPPAVPGQRFGTATPGFSVPGLPKCAYVLKMAAGLLLTTGTSEPGPLEDLIAFCK
jgi:hypothetical protein